MNYLSIPRIHFAGRFQADTSTVNNDVRHYDSSRFIDEFQQPMEVKNQAIVKFNGYWNPEGTGAWRMLGCRVNSVVTDEGICRSSEHDAAVGMRIGGSTDRVAGKLVDLDPQQQLVSQIWGLAINLETADGEPVFTSDFAVAPFVDLWQRQQNKTHFFDQTLAAAYQSQLINVRWAAEIESPGLLALKERSEDGLLSIRMNVFGYDRTPSAPDFRTGLVVGTIGPATAKGPKLFNLGRYLTAALKAPPFVPANKIGNVQAQVDSAGKTLAVDLGNALPTLDSDGTLEDLGRLSVGVLRTDSIPQGAEINAADVEVVGEAPYRSPGWLFQTAGVLDLPLNATAEELIGDHPLAILRHEASGFTVLNRETANGLYLRADAFVFRLNAGDSAEIDFYATRYGQPLQAEATAEPTTGGSDLMGGAGTGAKLPADYKIPPVRVPEGVIQYDRTFETNAADGHYTLTISAKPEGPGNPRGYLDGQLYGIAYQLKDLPSCYASNPYNYVSILAWDAFDMPDEPTWFEHVRPLLTQYGNLYPIMSRRLVDLGDYDSVIAHRAIIKLSLSLPVSDPNSMPVTRDLSDGRRACILKWLDAKDPKTGLPPKGDAKAAAPARSATTTREVAGDEVDLGSKGDFVRQVQDYNQSQPRREP